MPASAVVLRALYTTQVSERVHRNLDYRTQVLQYFWDLASLDPVRRVRALVLAARCERWSPFPARLLSLCDSIN